MVKYVTLALGILSGLLGLVLGGLALFEVVRGAAGAAAMHIGSTLLWAGAIMLGASAISEALALKHRNSE